MGPETFQAFARICRNLPITRWCFWPRSMASRTRFRKGEDLDIARLGSWTTRIGMALEWIGFRYSRSAVRCCSMFQRRLKSSHGLVIFDALRCILVYFDVF